MHIELSSFWPEGNRKNHRLEGIRRLSRASKPSTQRNSGIPSWLPPRRPNPARFEREGKSEKRRRRQGEEEKRRKKETERKINVGDGVSHNAAALRTATDIHDGSHRPFYYGGDDERQESKRGSQHPAPARVSGGTALNT
ncbi:hypothetical protein U1Q18_038671 [Sarracenia purpurea var. burkii]